MYQPTAIAVETKRALRRVDQADCRRFGLLSLPAYEASASTTPHAMLCKSLFSDELEQLRQAFAIMSGPFAEKKK